MITRTEYPAGVPCWIDLTQHDVDAATAFYGALFGWEFEDRLPPGSEARYVIARLDGQVVGGISTPDDTPTTGWWTYVAVDDADLAAKKVVEAGGTVAAGPLDVPHAGRYAVCADPTGALFSVWEPKARKGAEAVNVPGSWNFSDLSTPDPAAAAAFYDAVFGWKTWSIDMGEQEQATLFLLPGYRDFLATIDPEMPARHASMHIPEQFSDAVAWMAEGTPGWTVTFTVDGTDAAVERAVGLGATVVSPPTDAGPTRVAVLADPQGATFTVSTFTPPG